jgi:hypothetical protein
VVGVGDAIVAVGVVAVAGAAAGAGVVATGALVVAGGGAGVEVDVLVEAAKGSVYC